MTRTYIETYYAIPNLITRSKQKKHPKNCISQEKHKRDQINQPILPPLALKSDYCSLKDSVEKTYFTFNSSLTLYLGIRPNGSKARI